MLRVVVVLFRLDARVGDVVDLDRDAHLFGGSFHKAREIHDGELLGELVVDAAFASRSWIVAGDLDAANRVANVQEAAGLSAFAVNSERLADGRLYTEAGQHRAENRSEERRVGEEWRSRG